MRSVSLFLPPGLRSSVSRRFRAASQRPAPRAHACLGLDCHEFSSTPSHAQACKRLVVAAVARALCAPHRQPLPSSTRRSTLLVCGARRQHRALACQVARMGLDTPKVFRRPGTNFRYRREPPSNFRVCPLFGTPPSIGAPGDLEKPPKSASFCYETAGSALPPVCPPSVKRAHLSSVPVNDIWALFRISSTTAHAAPHLSYVSLSNTHKDGLAGLSR